MSLRQAKHCADGTYDLCWMGGPWIERGSWTLEQRRACALACDLVSMIVLSSACARATYFTHYTNDVKRVMRMCGNRRRTYFMLWKTGIRRRPPSALYWSGLGHATTIEPVHPQYVPFTTCGHCIPEVSEPRVCSDWSKRYVAGHRMGPDGHRQLPHLRASATHLSYYARQSTFVFDEIRRVARTRVLSF